MIREIYIPSYFKLEELVRSYTAEKEGISNYPSWYHLTEYMLPLCELILDPARKGIKMPITITSCYRCEALNKAVGGEAHSAHLVGRAADICCDDMTALWQRLKKNKNVDLAIWERRMKDGVQWIHVQLPVTGFTPRNLFTHKVI